MGDLIEATVSEQLMAACGNTAEAKAAIKEIERLTEGNTILEHRLADSHRNVDALKSRVEKLECEVDRLSYWKGLENTIMDREDAVTKREQALAATEQGDSDE